VRQPWDGKQDTATIDRAIQGELSKRYQDLRVGTMSEEVKQVVHQVEQTATHPTSSAIAIIGMAALFPGAPDLTTYWQNILGKVDAVTDPPSEAWDASTYFDPTSSERDRIYCQRGGFLGPIAMFNPLEHGIMPRAVDGGEPDQWLALKVARSALRDAGYLDRLDVRQRTAVVIGKGTYINRGNFSLVQHGVVVQQTLDILRELHPEFTADDLAAIREELKACLPPFTTETVPGLIPNIIAGRIANRLDLMGPSYTIDAACASSLLALQTAMRDLAANECDLALVGGAQVTTPIPILSLFCQLNALSRRQQIRPFDKDADGTILGEGVGMVVLKRQADAERDGDRIYALLKGVGVASDGRAVSVMAPRIEGEELALRRALDAAGVDPSTIELIEAHGTGTLAGDAAELQALSRVFGSAGATMPHCALGSVKSMIGHTMPAAGIAGVIKAALALHYKVLPPTINVSEPNSYLDASTFYLNTEARPWIHSNPDAPRRAGVNAFGFGGINAHAVLEEYPQAAHAELPSHQTTWDSEALILQGESPAALITKVERLQEFVARSEAVSLKDIAYSLNTQQTALPYRLALVATSVADLQKKLGRARQRLSDPTCHQIKDKSGIYYFAEPLGRQGKLAILFPGEGAQYTNMLADLCTHFPEVRAPFDLIDRVFRDHPRGYRCSDVVFPPALLPAEQRAMLNERLWQIDGAVEAILTANQGLYALVSRLALKPDLVVGHSTGEYSAMRAAGILGLDDEQVFTQFTRDLNAGHEAAATTAGVPEAAMLAVGAGHEQVAAIAAAVSSEHLFVAMDNCPHQAVIVGERSYVEQARAQVQQQGLASEFLAFDRAYHTPLFGPYTASLTNAFDRVPVSSPRLPIFSCTTAAAYPEDVTEIRHLMVDHWVRPVEFRRTVEALYEDGVRIFVEVGPRGNLTAFTDDILRGKSYCAVPTNVQHRSGITQLNHCVALLSAQGIDLDLLPLYERRSAELVDWISDTPATAPPAALGMNVATGFPILRLSPALMQDLRSRAAPAAATVSEAVGPTRHQVPLPEPVDYANPPASEPVFGSATEPHGLAALPPPSVPVEPLMTWPLNAAGPPAVEQAENTVTAADVSPVDLVSASGSSYEEPLPLATSAASATMMNYLETMDQFLALQDQVMGAYLHGPVSADGGQSPWLDHEPMQFQAAPPAILPTRPTDAVALPAVEVNAPAAAIPVRAPDVLGPAHPPAVALSPAPVAQDGRSTLTARLLALVSERTGYPTEMLDLRLDLEADLGIDSIKRIEILGTFRQQSPELVTLDLERLSAQRTLQQIIDLVGPPGVLTSGLGSASRTQDNMALAKGESIAAHVQYPLLGATISWTPGVQLTTQRTFDPAEDLYLCDHTLGRAVSEDDPDLRALAVMPLTMSLEILAEAAACLMSGDTVVRMEDIKAFRWIAFDGLPQVLRMTARRAPDSRNRVIVQIRNLTEDAESADPLKSPVIEATVVVADAYPMPPAVQALSLENQRPSHWRPGHLYDDAMFHGPRWQGVARMEHTGDNGAVAGLLVLPFGDFFASSIEPRFVLDPVVLDAAGQVIGFWTMERLATGKLIFPYRVTSLELYGPQRPEGEPIGCIASIELVGQQQVRSTIDMVDSDGQLWMRLVDWEDKRFELPSHFYDLLLSVRAAEIAADWPALLAHLEQPQHYACRATTGVFPSDQAFWKRVWANCILSRQEREVFRQLGTPESRQLSWLAGRAAAKQAVRQVVRAHYGRDLLPADISIIADSHGRPVVGGTWTVTVPVVPTVSISHTGDYAVALAGLAPNTPRVGIDVEQMRECPPSFIELVLTAEERRHLEQLPLAERDEWVLRCWCAKEALAKACGYGLVEGPHSIEILEVNATSQRVIARPVGELARRMSDTVHSGYIVHTGRYDSLVAATTVAERVGERMAISMRSW